jgi:hypothetical protein
MSNWDQVSNGGKGSSRRSGANDKAYADGWARIFGSKDKKEDGEDSGVSKDTEGNKE